VKPASDPVLNRGPNIVRRWVLSACVLVLATGAGGQEASQRKPGAPGSLPREAVPAAPLPSAQAQVPAHEAGHSSAAPAVSASARQWWLGLLGSLVAGLGLVALLARRRARTAAASAPTHADAWHGIGGPSYAPQPTTVRFESLTIGRQDTTRISGRPDAVQQQAMRRPFGVPDDFDTPGFLDSAKQSFVRLQSAWDRSDLHELDECTTDEMFNALTHELRVRAGPSRTEVMELSASLLGIETAAGEHRASVRFSGNLKVNGEDERLDEVWNLSKPVDGSNGWLLAGIQQLN
jgi:predicted lipid-binding transport protein (Tim44 family)